MSATRRRAPARTGSGLLALAVLGAVACALVWLDEARSAPRPPALTGELEPARVDRELADVPSEARRPAPVALASRPARDPLARGQAPLPPDPPRTEKEYLRAFRSLAERSPGALEACAGAILDGAGPEPEKLALLRALREGGSPERVAWLEHAARKEPGASPPPGLGLADVALGFLLLDSAREGAARRALARLAFEPPAPEAGLRRRAAAGFARNCDEAELNGLAPRLARETDELLVAGVLGALSERDPSAGRTRLLLAHGRGEAPLAPAPVE